MDWRVSKLTVLALIMVAIAIGFYYLTSGQSKPNAEVAPSPATTISPSPITTGEPATNPAVLSQTEYKDGVYEAEGKYKSPGGDESIDVKITIKDGKITESDVKPNATRPLSVKFQGQFVEGHKTLIMGKNLDEVELDKVSGSSLTPAGFMDALEQIKEKAKV